MKHTERVLLIVYPTKGYNKKVFPTPIIMAGKDNPTRGHATEGRGFTKTKNKQIDVLKNIPKTTNE